MVTTDEDRVYTARRLNRGQFEKICRLTGSKLEREKLVLDTFFECRDLRTGVRCENLGELTTVRAREFWIC